MKINLKKYNQYKSDIFNKLNFRFKEGKNLLDVGCGDGTDAEIFIKEFKLNTFGIDIYKHENIKKVKGLKYKKARIYKIPFKKETFDYVFLHDVLHHIDEKEQSLSKHIIALRELKRVCKKEGIIIIIEGNRYNPLFYPHMVKILGHNHWKQSYFKKTIKNVFSKVQFKFFEAHVYPKKFLLFWKVYERIMEVLIPQQFLAYNVAIITNTR